MKNKYLLAFFCLLFMLVPIIIFGQTETIKTGNTADYNKLLQYLKGDGAFEQWFMKVFTKLDTSISAEAARVSRLGRAIGGLGAFMYLGHMGWQMVSGDREWEITPMLRPFFIGLILINWFGFYKMIEVPFSQISTPSRAIFENIEQNANAKRVIKFQKQQELIDYIIKKKAEEIAKQKEAEKLEREGMVDEIVGGIQDAVGDVWNNIKSTIEEWHLRFDYYIQKTVADVIEAIGLSILRICTYLIFFIQKIWSYVLIVTGPIAVGMALIPGFENSLYSWVAKFININLYTFVTYTIINIGQQLIITAYDMEIDRYTQMISNTGVVDSSTIMAFLSSNGMIYMSLISLVSYVVTGIGVMMTPSIADSIVSAGGSAVMSKMKQNGGRLANAGKLTSSMTGAGATRIGSGATKIGGGLRTMANDTKEWLKNRNSDINKTRL